MTKAKNIVSVDVFRHFKHIRKKIANIIIFFVSVHIISDALIFDNKSNVIEVNT